MLQSIRDKTQGVFLWLVVGVIVATFALWGVNSFFSGDKGVYVARVGGEEISVAEYQRAYQFERYRMQQMFGANFNADMFDATVKKSALEGLIDTNVMTFAAKNAGFRVSDELLSQRIQSIEGFQQGGKFSKELYESGVKQQGETVAGFEQRVRRAMLSDQFTQGVALSNVTADSDIAAAFRLQQQKREFDYLLLPVARFKDGVKIDDARAKEYYEKNKAHYQTPEQVRVEYIEISAKDLEAAVKVDEQELKQFFDVQQQKNAKSEERHARHILVQVDKDASKEKIDAAKKKAEDIYKQLKKGGDFAKLAKKESDDPGSKDKGGDLGFFARGVMDEAFEKAAFALKKGQMSEPVRSRFGFHVIKLEEVRGEKTVTLNDRHAEVVAEYRAQAAEKRFAEIYENLANAVYEHPDSLSNAAQIAGVPIKSSDFFARNGGPGIAANPKVATAAFGNDVYKDNVNSELIELGNNHVIALRLKEKRPAADRNLEEVRPQIVNDLKDVGARDQVRDTGNSLVVSLNGGKDFATQAKDLKLALEKAQATRSDSKINGTLLRAVFKMPKPVAGKTHFEAVALDNGDYAVVGLHGVQDGLLTQADQAQKDAAKNDVQRMWSTLESSMLKKSLKDKIKIERFPDRL